MKKYILWISGILLVMALFVGAYLLYQFLTEDYSPNLLAGQTERNTPESTQSYAAPDFTVVDDGGTQVRLSHYFGKPIVLNFWASWCPPCKAEMPHFEAAYQENTDVQFLMVNMTTSDRESLTAAKELIKEEGYTFPVLFDTQGNAANAYGVSSLPLTLFIDKHGNLVTYATGMLSPQSLDKGISLIRE